MEESCELIEKFPFQFVILISSVLVILAWIGATMNNMFLCYLLAMGVVNYPGLCSYGVVDKFQALIGTHLKGVLGSVMGGGDCKKDE